MPQVDNAYNLWYETVVIANGEAVSSAVFAQGGALVGIIMPAAWTAAAIGFQASLDGVTYVPVYDNGGNPETSVAAASTYIAFPSSDAIFMPFLKCVSVTVATVTPVNQGGARTLTLVFKRFLN